MEQLSARDVKISTGNEIPGVAAAMVVGTLSGAVLTILPGLVSSLKQSYGFNDARLGYLASADLTGLTVGCAVGAALVRRLGLQRCSVVGLIICAIANAIAAAVSGFLPLLV